MTTQAGVVVAIACWMVAALGIVAWLELVHPAGEQDDDEWPARDGAE